MRTPKLLYAACALALLVAPAALANGSGNGIVGSPHDFSAESWNFRQEICRVCHVPHDHGRDIGLVGLLWNHALPNHAYTMYSSDTLDGAIDAEPTGISKMCLGCHDGTVAIDEFDKNIGSGGTLYIQDEDPDARIPNVPGGEGTDLRATHPLSIVYDENADPGLHPKTDPMGTSGTIADVLQNGKVQCSSCHDVHDSPGEAVPNTHLLRVAQTTNQGGSPSGLCLTCHAK
ncbi:MAG: cytochrome C [Acidobacteria bacterium]|nr:MAG: cytochrome C [Acidobacteriota bacterium]